MLSLKIEEELLAADDKQSFLCSHLEIPSIDTRKKKGVARFFARIFLWNSSPEESLVLNQVEHYRLWKVVMYTCDASSQKKQHHTGQDMQSNRLHFSSKLLNDYL